MFSYKFAAKLFESFSILRWTDYIRPIEFVEIDKHALKSALTFIIGKEYEERTKKTLDWDLIAKSNVLALLKKVATSDIKSTLHAQIKENSKDKLNEYIINSWYDQSNKPSYFPAETLSKEDFNRYLGETTNYTKNKALDISKISVEDAIIYFAHKYVTRREFEVISILNNNISDLETAKRRTNDAINTSGNPILSKHSDLIPIFNCLVNGYEMADSDKKSPLYELYTYFETLRPQTRWSQTCRIPPTSVLGHSMYVAILTYFASQELKLDKNTVVNNFYAGLFHDLPESFTRDVISPVKNSIQGLNDLLKTYEAQMVKERIIDKVQNKEWCTEFKCLIGYYETQSKDDPKKMEVIIDDSKDRDANGIKVSGVLIKFMDKIAAFMEAKLSVMIGIDSYELQKGLRYTQNTLKNKKYPENKNENQNQLFMNDFFASIPHYTIGEE